MQNGDLPRNIPLLRPQSQRIKFVCKAGHEYESPSAWRPMFPAGGGQLIQGPPSCPECVFSFLGYSFPSWPAGMTMEMAVEQGLLHKAVLPKEDDV